MVNDDDYEEEGGWKGGGAGGGDGEDEQPVRPTRCVEVEPSQSRTLD